MKWFNYIVHLISSYDKNSYATADFYKRIQLFYENTNLQFQSRDYVVGLALNDKYFVYNDSNQITIIYLQNKDQRKLYKENKLDYYQEIQLFKNTSLLAIGFRKSIVIFDVLKFGEVYKFELNSNLMGLLLTQNYIINTCHNSIQFRAWGQQKVCHQTQGRPKYNSSIQMQSSLIVVCWGEYCIRVYSIHNKLVRKLQSHQGYVKKALFYNSNTLVSVSRDQQIKFWDLERGKTIISFVNYISEQPDICIINNSIYYTNMHLVKKLDLSELKFKIIQFSLICFNKKIQDK